MRDFLEMCFEDIYATLITLCITTMAVLMVWAILAGAKDWTQFRTDHHCRVVGQMDGSTGIGPNMSGNGGVSVVFIAGKTGWLCDDGITYWK